MEMLNKCPADPDDEVKKTKRQEYAAGWLTKSCNVVSSRLAVNEGPFLLGGAIFY